MIRDSINTKLVPALASINCVIPKELFETVVHKSDLEPYDLAHIADFNSLIAISQQLSKPIFALTQEEIHSVGKVFGYAEGTMLESRDKFALVFEELGDRVKALTS